MHECLLLDKTSGWVTEQKEEFYSEKRCFLDWNSELSRIHFESNCVEAYADWNKKDKKTTSSTKVAIATTDNEVNIITVYVLVIDATYTGYTYMREIVGNYEHHVLKDTPEYKLNLEKVSNLLADKNMDTTTSSILKFVLDQMQKEKCEDTSCPEFLSRLVELGNKQQEQKMKQRQNLIDDEGEFV